MVQDYFLNGLEPQRPFALISALQEPNIYPTLVKGTITFNSDLSGDMLVPLEGKGLVHSQILGTIHLQ